MDCVLFRHRVRGTTREGDRVRLSLSWALARRADLVLTETELAWGDWRVPYAEIEDAVLVCLGSIWWRLIVRGRGAVYQFLLPPASLWTWRATVDPIWNGPLPFPLRRVRGRFEWRSVAVWLGLQLLLGVTILVLALTCI
jgi:hypothetical protein